MTPADKHRSRARANPLGWFEDLYSEAERRADLVPWADDRENPNLSAWADSAEGKSILAASKTALVIGCGLGDDAEFLASKVSSVRAFDISPTAIAWTGERFPNSRVHYSVEDLFELKTECDFVFESYTVQALPPELRTRALLRLPELTAPGGSLLLICRGRENSEPVPDLPPWPLSREDLAVLDSKMDIVRFEDYKDMEDGGIRRFRVLYKKKRPA